MQKKYIQKIEPSSCYHVIVMNSKIKNRFKLFIAVLLLILLSLFCLLGIGYLFVITEPAHVFITAEPLIIDGYNVQSSWSSDFSSSLNNNNILPTVNTPPQSEESFSSDRSSTTMGSTDSIRDLNRSIHWTDWYREKLSPMLENIKKNVWTGNGGLPSRFGLKMKDLAVNIFPRTWDTIYPNSPIWNQVAVIENTPPIANHDPEILETTSELCKKVVEKQEKFAIDSLKETKISNWIEETKESTKFQNPRAEPLNVVNNNSTDNLSSHVPGKPSSDSGYSASSDNGSPRPRPRRSDN